MPTLGPEASWNLCVNESCRFRKGRICMRSAARTCQGWVAPALLDTVRDILASSPDKCERCDAATDLAYDEACERWVCDACLVNPDDAWFPLCRDCQADVDAMTPKETAEAEEYWLKG